MKISFNEALRVTQLARMVKSLRKKEKLTQPQLAARAGMKTTQIQRLENPHYNPTIVMVERIARAFGKRLEVRFVDAGEPVIGADGHIISAGGWESDTAKLIETSKWSPNEVIRWLEESNQLSASKKNV